MKLPEKLMWLIAQKSPIHRRELRARLDISEDDCERVIEKLEGEARLVRCGYGWIAASFFEVLFGPGFKKELFCYRKVELGGSDECSR